MTNDPATSHAFHRNNTAWQKNRELEAEGKSLFLAGDEEGAKQKLGECQWSPHQDVFCYQGELLLQIKLLSWELEAHDLPAALRRFRTNNLGPLEPAWARNVAQAYILAGRQSEIAYLLSEVDGRVRVAAAEGRLGVGATLRNSANTGAPMIAIESALIVGRTVEERVVALAIVAEGLAGLPGLPDEGIR